jgi:hypothetical protein
MSRSGSLLIASAQHVLNLRDNGNVRFAKRPSINQLCLATTLAGALKPQLLARQVSCQIPLEQG